MIIQARETTALGKAKVYLLKCIIDFALCRYAKYMCLEVTYDPVVRRVSKIMTLSLGE